MIQKYRIHKRLAEKNPIKSGYDYLEIHNTKCNQTSCRITGSDVCNSVCFLNTSHKIRNHEATKRHGEPTHRQDISDRNNSGNETHRKKKKKKTIEEENRMERANDMKIS